MEDENYNFFYYRRFVPVNDPVIKDNRDAEMIGTEKACTHGLHCVGLLDGEKMLFVDYIGDKVSAMLFSISDGSATKI